MLAGCSVDDDPEPAPTRTGPVVTERPNQEPVTRSPEVAPTGPAIVAVPDLISFQAPDGWFIALTGQLVKMAPEHYPYEIIELANASDMEPRVFAEEMNKGAYAIALGALHEGEHEGGHSHEIADNIHVARNEPAGGLDGDWAREITDEMTMIGGSCTPVEKVSPAHLDEGRRFSCSADSGEGTIYTDAVLLPASGRLVSIMATTKEAETAAEIIDRVLETAKD